MARCPPWALDLTPGDRVFESPASPSPSAQKLLLDKKPSSDGRSHPAGIVPTLPNQSWLWQAHCHITEHSSKAHLQEASPAVSLLLPGYILICIICSHCQPPGSRVPKEQHDRTSQQRQGNAFLAPSPTLESLSAPPSSLPPFSVGVCSLGSPPSTLTQRSLLPALHHSL